MRVARGAFLLTIILSTASSGLAATHSVTITEFMFTPSSLTIALGDSVHWTNMGTVHHTVTSGLPCTFDGNFNSGTLLPGQGFGWKFTTPGSFPYFCNFHCPTMTASVSIDPASSGAESVKPAVLLAASPNPFVMRTTIALQLSEARPVRLSIHDVDGRLVAVLFDQTLPAGRHTLVWDGRGADGRQLASGVYYSQLVAGPELVRKSVILLR